MQEQITNNESTIVDNREIKKQDSKPERTFVDIPLPEFSVFMKAGSQFGHQTNKWNPKMSKYIHTSKNGIHIIDLTKTLSNLSKALRAAQLSASKGDVLFVSTKGQAADIVKNEAMRCGAHFITNRWVGGLFTNFKQVKESIDRLNELETMFEEGVENRTKQEISWLKAEWERLNRLYGGVKYMKRLPSMVFVIDVNFEKGAVSEAKSSGITTVALVDTNSDPTTVEFPIPGNDDATSSIQLVTKLVADAVLDGNQGSGIRHFFKDYNKMDVLKKIA